VFARFYKQTADALLSLRRWIGFTIYIAICVIAYFSMFLVVAALMTVPIGLFLGADSEPFYFFEEDWVLEIFFVGLFLGFHGMGMKKLSNSSEVGAKERLAAG
tara:strand:- start:187 stop:495 length:309 start_codon:yes stop_codon:yes gene_type:complete